MIPDMTCKEVCLVLHDNHEPIDPNLSLLEIWIQALSEPCHEDFKLSVAFDIVIAKSESQATMTCARPEAQLFNSQPGW